MGIGSSTAATAAPTNNICPEVTINQISDAQLLLFLERVRRIKEVKGDLDDLKIIEIMRNVDWSKDINELFIPADEKHEEHGNCPVIPQTHTDCLTNAEPSAPPLIPIAVGFPTNAHNNFPPVIVEQIKTEVEAQVQECKAVESVCATTVTTINVSDDAAIGIPSVPQQQQQQQSQSKKNKKKHRK